MNSKNVLLIQPFPHQSLRSRHISTSFLPINLLYLASSLEAVGANVLVKDYCAETYKEEAFVNLLLDFDPCIIGFTSISSTIYHVETIAKVAKDVNNKIMTILGGIHISVLPKESLQMLSCIDLGVVGEGEETLVELYHNKKDLGRIHGIVYRTGENIHVTPKRDLIDNIDCIPFPARHLVDIAKYKNSHVDRGITRRKYNVMEIFTSRGCPNECIFCAGHVIYRNSYRSRSYEDITKEIELLVSQYGINYILIKDDTFTLNRKLVEKMCQYFRANKLLWSCNARVNTVDRGLLKLMKESGCDKISFGVESGSQRILRLLKKNIFLDQIKNAVMWSKTVGIRFVETSFILGGHPEETIDDINLSESLIFQLLPDFLVVSIICPFPGTEVYKIMSEQGLLDRDLDWSAFTFINNNPPFRRLKYISAEQLLSEQKRILKRYYLSPRYIFQVFKKIEHWSELLYFIELLSSFLFGFLFVKKNKDF